MRRPFSTPVSATARPSRRRATSSPRVGARRAARGPEEGRLAAGPCPDGRRGVSSSDALRKNVMTDLVDMSATALLAGFAARSVSPSEVWKRRRGPDRGLRAAHRGALRLRSREGAPRRRGLHGALVEGRTEGPARRIAGHGQGTHRDARRAGAARQRRDRVGPGRRRRAPGGPPARGRRPSSSPRPPARTTAC